MNKLYYENRAPEEDARIHGLTEFISSTIYIDEELDGFLLAKTLRHELAHVYVWETGQQGRIYNEEEICEVLSVAAPAICKTTDDIMFRLKEATYRKGE